MERVCNYYFLVKCQMELFCIYLAWNDGSWGHTNCELELNNGSNLKRILNWNIFQISGIKISIGTLFVLFKILWFLQIWTNIFVLSCKACEKIGFKIGLIWIKWVCNSTMNVMFKYMDRDDRLVTFLRKEIFQLEILNSKYWEN